MSNTTTSVGAPDGHAVVYDHHTLGVRRGSTINILRTSPVLGSPLDVNDQSIPYIAGSCRPATRRDFDDFRVVWHPDYKLLNDYRPYLKPIVANCYVVIIATGKAGQVTNKYRNGSKVTYGIAWDTEYTASELCRITPKEYHALPANRKITSYDS